MGVLKKVGIGIGIAIGGFFVLVIISAVLMDADERQAIQNSKELLDGSNNIQTKPEQKQGFDSKPIVEQNNPKDESNIYEIGNTIMLDNVLYNVTSEIHLLDDLYLNPKNVTYWVEIKMTNIGKEPITVYDDSFLLIDGKDRKYEPRTALYPGAFVHSEKLNPDLPKTFYLYFDIPYDDEIQYFLRITEDRYGLTFPKLICLQNC